ncbi:MAG: 3-oxoacyl-[acyl-carrier-protein] synthase III C-terminal domain-containing protein [Myxococcota bacterium]
MARIAGLRALSVHFPEEVRTNDWWRVHHPELVADAERRTLAKVFSQQGEPTTIFDRAMRPYESDPFRGAVERRVAGDTGSIDLEIEAARKALVAADLEPGDVDLLISTGFPREQLVIGNAVDVAAGLRLRGAAWNLESACGGPLNALITAAALVDAGQYRRVLVSVSCTYLHSARANDSLSWFMGDGAGAFVVAEGGARLLGGFARHTAETRGTWFHDIDEDGLRMRASPKTGPVMRATAEPQLRSCTAGALEAAGLTLSDIDFFVFHTPTAWFADFAAEALGIPRDRTVSTYERYANVGPALTPTNLFEAASTGRIAPGDRVLVFGPGSASSSAAVVLEWADVGLSEAP